MNGSIKYANTPDFLIFKNASVFEIPLPYEPSNVHYGTYVLSNMNTTGQNFIVMVNTNGSLEVVHTGSSARTFTVEITGQTMKITPSVTAWGLTLVIGKMI